MKDYYLVVVDRLERQEDGVRNESWDQHMKNVELVVDLDGLHRLMESNRVTAFHSIHRFTGIEVVAGDDTECLVARQSHLNVVAAVDRAEAATRLRCEAERLTAQAAALETGR